MSLFGGSATIVPASDNVSTFRGDERRSTMSFTSAARRASSPGEIVVGAGSVRPHLPFDRAGVRSVREGIPLPATAEARSEGEGSKNGQAHDPGMGPHTTVSLEDGDRRTNRLIMGSVARPGIPLSGNRPMFC